MMILSLLLFISVHADTLESNFLRQLAHGKSHAEIAQMTEAYTRSKILHEACRIEWRENLLPRSCYEELAELQMTAKLRQERLVVLDRRCTQLARQLAQRLPDPGAVSPACAAEVRRAQEIQAYRDEELPQSWSEN